MKCGRPSGPTQVLAYAAGVIVLAGGPLAIIQLQYVGVGASFVLAHALMLFASLMKICWEILIGRLCLHGSDAVFRWTHGLLRAWCVAWTLGLTALLCLMAIHLRAVLS